MTTESRSALSAKMSSKGLSSICRARKYAICEKILREIKLGFIKDKRGILIYYFRIESGGLKLLFISGHSTVSASRGLL